MINPSVTCMNKSYKPNLSIFLVWLVHCWYNITFRQTLHFCINLTKLYYSTWLTRAFFSLTVTPGIAEQDEFAEGALLLVVTSEHTQLKLVAAHRGRGRRGDGDGGVLEVQALWFNVSFPVGGRNLLVGESDWHYHIETAWKEKKDN